MSESIINALMRLFAIIESIKDEVADSGKIIVKPYLEKQLNHELAEQYLHLFQDYVEFYRREASSSVEELENEAKNIIRVTRICQQINKELLQNERVIVFIQLVELINTDNKVSRKENDFMRLVSLNFNLPKQEINDICSFILDPAIKELSKANGLIIDSKVAEWSEKTAWMMKKKSEPGVTEFRHLYVENLFGKIKVLFIHSISSFVVQYDGSLNLFLEGNKLLKNKTYILKPGAIIKGNTIEPIYESEISKKFLLDLKKINLVLHGDQMEFQFKNSENGIRPFSFYEESGQLIGIMGGSGTGKSTLINLLNGKLKPSAGKIQINGHSITKSVHAGVIGYVPQDDLLFEELTVYENLYFNARLSFSYFSKSRLNISINRVLENLGIYEIKDLIVGNPLNKYISGGQRKRLNIALELLREPSVLYVDEPTSGLSSMDSEIVMNLLKGLSRKGKLVISIIHQPSSDIFKLFDKLWLLDKGGYPIYNGHPVDSIVYFKKMNTQVNAAESECRTCGNVIPEQVLHIIEARDISENGTTTKERKISPKQWNEKYLKNIAPKLKKLKFQTALPPSNFLIPTRLQQSNIFLQRILKSKKTNIQYILLNVLEPPLLAFILGILAKYSVGAEYIFAENKNVPVYLFMAIVVSLFLGLSVSAEEIFKDRKVLERESFLNLSRLSYINSKIVYLFGLSGLQMLLFVLFGNYIMEIQGLSFQYWLVLFSTACFANMLGLNISSGLNSIVTIYILIPLILVPQLLLGGAMIKFDELHHRIGNKKNVPLIGDMMVSRWGYEALAVEQFKNNRYEKYFYDADKRMSEASYKFAYLIPRIESKLETILANIAVNNKPSILQDEINICVNELTKLQSVDNNNQFYKLRFLTMNKYDSVSNAQIISQLGLLKKKYRNMKANAVKDREAIYYDLIEKMGAEELLKLKNDNHNKTLANLVTNREVIEKIYETDIELIQKKDPIFMTPDSKLGNAHVYAPVKVVGDMEIDTFYFNIIIIWLVTALFYMTLYYDTLRKLLDFLSNKFSEH